MAVCQHIADLDLDLDKALAEDWSLEAGPVLSETVAELVAMRAKLDALTVQATAAWVASADWAVQSRNPKVWLKANTKSSGPAAGRQVHHARKLSHMALTAEALAAGRITADHVARLIRANSGRTALHFDGEAEEYLVGCALRMEFTDFDRAVTYWEQVVDPDGAEAEALDEDGGDWWAGTGLAGRTEAGGILPPLGGKEYRNELDRLARMEVEGDWAEARERVGGEASVDDMARTAGQRRVAAQVEMARRSADYGPQKAPAAKRVVNVHMDHETARAQTALLWGADPDQVAFPHDRVCELDDGTILTPCQVLNARAVAELWFRRLVFGPGSYDLDLGKERRFFTGAAREAVVLRDRRCTAPGCDIPARDCHIDHIIEHERGGPTIVGNGQALCPGDNLHKENRRQTRRPPPRQDE